MTGLFYPTPNPETPLPCQVSLMAWAGVFFKKGFQASGTMDELKWKVKHGADYLLNSLVSQDPCIFAGANGNSTQYVHTGSSGMTALPWGAGHVATWHPPGH